MYGLKAYVLIHIKKKYLNFKIITRLHAVVHGQKGLMSAQADHLVVLSCSCIDLQLIRGLVFFLRKAYNVNLKMFFSLAFL